MKLMRFLSSGSRGLTKGAPEMGRYRLPDGRLIPDFGSTKNPFVPKTLPVPEDSPSAAGVTARAASTQAAPPSPVPLQQKSGTGMVRLLASGAGVLSGLLSRVKSVGLQLVQRGKRVPSALIARLRRRKNRAPWASSVAPQAPGPLQGELSLESVRVVRNDLTDTDYEVVCPETSTASPVKRVPQAEGVSTESRPLGRLANRLFSQKTE